MTYGGTFRVVELKKGHAPVPGGKPVRFSWGITQNGVTYVYKKKEGWDIDLNPYGIHLDKDRVHVWYYGTFMLDARDR